MQNMHDKKFSKLSIFSTAVAVLCFLGLVGAGVTYKNQLEFLTTNIVDIIILVAFYFIMKNVTPEKYKGDILAKIGFYGFLAGYLIWLIASIILINKTDSIKTYAETNTPKAFTTDLAELPNYSTKDLAKIIQNSKEFEGYKDKMKEVGNLKECSFNEDDTIEVGFGPYLSYGKIKVGYLGGYGIHCYGEDKVLIIGVGLKNENGEWKISDFAFNSNITKNIDVEKTELEESIKNIKN